MPYRRSPRYISQHVGPIFVGLCCLVYPRNPSAVKGLIIDRIFIYLMVISLFIYGCHCKIDTFVRYSMSVVGHLDGLQMVGCEKRRPGRHDPTPTADTASFVACKWLNNQVAYAINSPHVNVMTLCTSLTIML